MRVYTDVHNLKNGAVILASRVITFFLLVACRVLFTCLHFIYTFCFVLCIFLVLKVEHFFALEECGIRVDLMVLR